jgi:putative tricarboxylic transport membrane protein
MKRINQWTAIIFLLLSAYIVWYSLMLEYYTSLGPGPGFFPLWLGVAMGILSMIWFVQIKILPRQTKDEDFLPKRSGVIRILSIIGALVMISYLMDIFGFQLMMFLFLVFLLIILGRQPVWLTLVVSFLGSFGVYHLFGGYLDVSLPEASVSILAKLGL